MNAGQTYVLALFWGTLNTQSCIRKDILSILYGKFRVAALQNVLDTASGRGALFCIHAL